MVLPKSKKTVGLGNSLIKDRKSKARGNQGGIQRKGEDGETYISVEKKEASWVKMRSVTEQGALDEFLSTAELAGTDFTAERINNVKIIHKDQRNPFLLSADEERATVRKHAANKKRLTVPRRPAWDTHTSPAELDARERAALMEWRRGLAELQENHDLLMTPFERNLEVWRQLWRVIERSDLVVQIVDARNPLLFRSEDLENYVKEVDPNKENLLLVNKADMMTLEQRTLWARYFESAGIKYKFFSAELARERNEAMITEEDEEQDMEREEEEDSEEEEGSEEHAGGVELDPEESAQALSKEAEKLKVDDEVPGQEPAKDVDDEYEKTRIITTDDLEDLFLQHAPDIDTGPDGNPRKTQIGLVGYPNVGKSSTINALIGAKKVSVSATPGKTKHFQTIHLSDKVVLCDCPGLVFPNFATTKAELVCSGVLPIDQLREFTGPAGLVAQRIPQHFLEAIYGMKIHTRPLEEGGTGVPTAEEVLRAYATARGFSTQGLGQPDESRAARYVLKDYVKGKLLFCHPPPSDPPIDPHHFNRDLYDASHLPEKRRAAFTAQSEVAASAIGSEDPSIDDLDMIPLAPVQGEKTAQLDKRFFARGQGHVSTPFGYSGLASGKNLSGRKLREMVALEKDIDPADLRLNGKKHFKGNKRKGKQRAEYN